jgi:hypothetical protein
MKTRVTGEMTVFVREYYPEKLASFADGRLRSPMFISQAGM